MNSMASDQTGDPTETDPSVGWNRYLRAGMGFLVFEAMIVFILGGPFLGDSDSTLLFIVIAGAGGVGYLLLGVFAGTWLSVLFIGLPILIAVPIGGTVADGGSASEIPLYVSWTFLTLYFFAPAWLFGLLISFLLRTYPADPA